MTPPKAVGAFRVLGMFASRSLLRAALIPLGIFSLPDRAEEWLRPPQGAGESSWPSSSGLQPCRERCPALGSGRSPAHGPGREGEERRRRNPRPHRALAARLGLRVDFCSLPCLAVTLGTKDHGYSLHLQRLLPCPALPCQPWLLGLPNPQV